MMSDDVTNSSNCMALLRIKGVIFETITEMMRPLQETSKLKMNVTEMEVWD